MAILKTTGSNAGRLNFHFYVAHPGRLPPVRTWLSATSPKIRYNYVDTANIVSVACWRCPHWRIPWDLRNNRPGTALLKKENVMKAKSSVLGFAFFLFPIHSWAQNAAGAMQALGNNTQSSGIEGKFRYYVSETYLNPSVFTAPAFR